MAPEVLAVLAAAALIGGGVYAAYRVDKRRTDQLRTACQTMGFRWVGEEEGVLTEGLPLFEQGHGRKARNAMQGELAGHPVTLMDYQYVTGGGRNRATHRQTVALFASAAHGLPDFTLAPENVFHKIGQVFGYQDIDFPDSSEFSAAYLLRGEDEEGIRRAFNATARAFLAQHRGWSVQTSGGAAALFRAGRRCKPVEAPPFLADALRIISALSPRGAS